MNQQSFCGIDYGFEFTPDGWYEWDRKAGNKAAMQARNLAAKKAKADGRRVRCWTSRDQLMSRGGIGSGKPHIELHCTCYMLNIG